MSEPVEIYEAQVKSAAAKNLFDQCAATPIELATELTAMYGKDWIEWEPETLWSAINIDESNELCQFNKNKIMAMRVVVSNDLFWKDWMTFEKVSMALNNITPRFDMIESPSPAMMAYSVRVVVDLNRLPILRRSGRERVFASEVKSYIANQAFLEGVVYLPPPIDFAQSKLNEISGMANLAKAIQVMTETGTGKADETPEGVGAVRALAIKKYAYDNKRKPLV